MSRPEKGTPEFDLWVAAIDVATSPPLKGGQAAYSAQVPWSEILRLRAALEAVGIDWRAAKTKSDAKPSKTTPSPEGEQ